MFGFAILPLLLGTVLAAHFNITVITPIGQLNASMLHRQTGSITKQGPFLRFHVTWVLVGSEVDAIYAAAIDQHPRGRLCVYCNNETTTLKWNALCPPHDVQIVVLPYSKIKDSRYGNGERRLGIRRTANDSWVYFLDDDNSLHEHFFMLIWHYLELSETVQPNLAMILFSQVRGGALRNLTPFNPVLNSIDTAQVIAKRSEFSPNDWPIAPYNADGMFIQHLFTRLAPLDGAVILSGARIVYHNKLRWSK